MNQPAHLQDPEMPVVCASCHRAFGVSADSLANGRAPYSTETAGPTARLTGWGQSVAGEWYCGIVCCEVPA